MSRRTEVILCQGLARKIFAIDESGVELRDAIMAMGVAVRDALVMERLLAEPALAAEAGIGQQTDCTP
jgi:hypothetical protein